MQTLTNFTRVADPIDSVALSNKISSDIGTAVTAEMLVDYTIAVTGNITETNRTAIQNSINTYVYVVPPNTFLTRGMLDTDTSLVADSNTMLATQKAIKTYVDGVKRKTYVNGSLKSSILDWTDSVNTSGGQAVFYITSDKTATGTAMASNLYPDTIQINLIDSSGVYSPGQPVISADKKTITIPLKKQLFTGVTLLSTNILGSVSQVAIPDGILVKMQVIGSAA